MLISVKNAAPASKILFMTILLHRFMIIHSFCRFRTRDGCAMRHRRQRATAPTACEAPARQRVVRNIKFWRGDLLVGCWRHVSWTAEKYLGLQRSLPEKPTCLRWLCMTTPGLA